jgi:hypothetical protein
LPSWPDDKGVFRRYLASVRRCSWRMPFFVMPEQPDRQL